MVNKEFLSKMKTDAVLINTSRGEIIDEEALIDHLQTNKNFWVGLDVFKNEPSDKKGVFESSLAQHERVYGTHHIGASTKQSEAEIGAETVRMILKYSNTGRLDNCVNMSKSSKKHLILKYKSGAECMAKLFTALLEAKAIILSSEFESFEGGKAGLARIGLDGGDDDLLNTSLKQILEILEFKFLNCL
jgi:D-3-phosphoglycerate dehydrogenase